MDIATATAKIPDKLLRASATQLSALAGTENGSAAGKMDVD